MLSAGFSSLVGFFERLAWGEPANAISRLQETYARLPAHSQMADSCRPSMYLLCRKRIREPNVPVGITLRENLLKR
jgi:hypothetical protein